MRILHWAFPYFPVRGGQSIFIERMALESLRLGHQVAIIVSTETDQGKMRKIVGDKIEIIPLKISVGDLRSDNGHQLMRVATTIDQFKPDLIHVHNLKSQELVYLRFYQSTKGKNVPVICTLHDLVSLQRLKVLISNDPKLLSYSAVVSPSKYFANQFESVSPNIKGKFRMIYHGVPDILPSSMGISTDPHILFAADLHEHKGGIQILSAWSLIFKKYPQVTLTIAGDGIAKEFLAQYATSAGMGEQVKFVGWLSQAELLAKLGDNCIFVMPSMLGEAFGLIAAEAAMAGASIIAHRVGALPEIVEDGVSGIVVTPGDTQAMATELERLLNDSKLRISLGQHAKIRAEELFSMKVSVAEYEKLYADVAKT